MVLLGEEAHVESWYYLFGDSSNLDARLVHGCIEHTICSEINLDTPNGTVDAPDGTTR